MGEEKITMDDSYYKCEVCGMTYMSGEDQNCPHYKAYEPISKMGKRIRRIKCIISKFFFTL